MVGQVIVGCSRLIHLPCTLSSAPSIVATSPCTLECAMATAVDVHTDQRNITFKLHCPSTPLCKHPHPTPHPALSCPPTRLERQQDWRRSGVVRGCHRGAMVYQLQDGHVHQPRASRVHREALPSVRRQVHHGSLDGGTRRSYVLPQLPRTVPIRVCFCTHLQPQPIRVGSLGAHGTPWPRREQVGAVRHFEAPERYEEARGGDPQDSHLGQSVHSTLLFATHLQAFMCWAGLHGCKHVLACVRNNTPLLLASLLTHLYHKRERDYTRVFCITASRRYSASSSLTLHEHSS
jgi:hypothetical protein